MKALEALGNVKQVTNFELSISTVASESLLDPLLAACHLIRLFSSINRQDVTCQLQPCVPLNQPKPKIRPKTGMDAEYWHLRGPAIRAIRRALSDPVQARSCEFTAALHIISMLDYKYGYHKNSMLYIQILRWIWSYQQYRRESATIRTIMISAFSAAVLPERRVLTFNQNINVALKRVEHFGDALSCHDLFYDSTTGLYGQRARAERKCNRKLCLAASRSASGQAFGPCSGLRDQFDYIDDRPQS